MSRIFRYILESDGGMAPCPQEGAVTLGTCKPGIRKSATIGDWVAGFMPGSLNRGDMVWAGQVAEKLSHDEYRQRYPKRRDAIYALRDDGIYCSYLPGYHCDPTDQSRDYSSPVLDFAKELAAVLATDFKPSADDSGLFTRMKGLFKGKN